MRLQYENEVCQIQNEYKQKLEKERQTNSASTTNIILNEIE